MLKLITLASVAFIAASCPSLSVIAQGKPAATIGAGATTCGEFANYYRLDMKIEKHYFAWAQGYLTAFNAIGGHFLNLKPPAFSGEDQKTFLRPRI